MNTVGQIRFYNGLVPIRKAALAILQLTLEFEATFKDVDIAPHLRGVVLNIDIEQTRKEVNDLLVRLAGTDDVHPKDVE